MTNKILSVLFMSTILMTAGVAASVEFLESADALKSKGTYQPKYGSSTAVCGVELCSETEDKTTPVKSTAEKKQTQKTEPKKHEMKKDVSHGWKTASGTMTSMTDPGMGHESHQLTIILPPSDNVYKGILSYDASEPIQLVALHGPLAEGEDKGQAIWSPDGETKFALTFVDNESSMGTWLFAGNALAVHTMNEDEFTVSYSVVAGQ